ncbi:PorV/PorQ family protein [candidate division KSB1 bacterium]|nr:PorV/PorQ family protein [candidate division KSB1 bacterium]
MKNLRKNLLMAGILFSTLLLISKVYAQGTTSLFNDAGAGARALGLGNAYVALADDPSAVFWNPAGLAFIEKKRATFFYSNLIAESSYGFVGLSWPTTSIGSFGFGWMRLSSGNIEEFDIDPIPVSSFDYSQQLFLFSYGKQVRESLSLGLTFKVENLNLDNSFNRFGSDFGLLYRPDFDSAFLRDISLGFNVQSFLKTQAKLFDNSESSPRNLKVGLEKHIVIGEERNMLRFLLDWNNGQNASSSWHFGTEYSFNDVAKLRLGINDGQFAFGAGATYGNFHLDYNFGKLFEAADFSVNHRFSITFDIGKTKTELIRIAQEETEMEFRFRADREAWFKGEQEFSTRMQKGRGKYFTKDYLGSVVDFDRAKDAADSLLAVGQRLRGAISDDLEANLRVETALSAVQEAQAMLDSANIKYEVQNEAEFKRIASEAAKSEREDRLRRFVLSQRNRGTAFFKQSLFARAIREWQAALAEINGFDNGALPNWTGEIKIQLENNIKMAGTQLEGDVRQAIKKADALARRGRYVQALQELNKVLRTGVSESERKTVEGKIGRLQSQLNFDENYDEGVRAYANKQWQNAMDALERALKNRPNHKKAKKYFADAKARSLATIKQMPPGVRMKFLRGVEFYRSGKYQEALSILEQANQEQPFNKNILDLIDRTLQKMNEQ